MKGQDEGKTNEFVHAHYDSASGFLSRESQASRIPVDQQDRDSDLDPCAPVAVLGSVRSEMESIRSSIGAITGLGSLGLGDEEMPDEVLIQIACFLDSRQLGRLACVSRRFAAEGLPAAERARSELGPSKGQ